MRLDYGFAEPRVTGWIPTFATVTAWTDDAGAARWERLPERADDLLAVPGLRPHGQERITVSVARFGPSGLRPRDQARRPASGRLRDRPGQRDAQAVHLCRKRAGGHDRPAALRGARRHPLAGVRAGLAAVAVAEAATRSAETGRTLPVTIPSPRPLEDPDDHARNPVPNPAVAEPATGGSGGADRAVPWWRDAVCYEIYPRSFADSDGDGVGDLAGATARLGYLRTLGVDAVWITPFYRS